MAFWTCPSCTCVNKESSNNCEACQHNKKRHPFPISSSSSPSPSLSLRHFSSSSFDPDTSKWGCRACTFLNKQVDAVCDICGTPKSSISLDAFAEFDCLLEEEEDGDDDNDHRAGMKSTKFWPLRSCTVASVQETLKDINVSQNKTKNDQESFSEHLKESKNGEESLFKHIKNTPLFKNTKESPLKNAKGADESSFRNIGNTRETLFKDTKNSPLTTTKSTKESILKNTKNKKGTLFMNTTHTEESLFKEGEDLVSNMVRSTTSNGIKKRKSPDDENGSSHSVSGVTRTRSIKQPQVKALVKQPGTIGTGNQSILVLTYNVWFREDIELSARMSAIGDIICEHNPHFVCLQEVTPAIYKLFESSLWWNEYQCSVTPSFASKRAYFCLQLSRVPNTNFSKGPYHNTIMGRELCISKVGDIVGSRGLLVATTHLESPCPSPPTWDQMFSEERIAQANQAFRALEGHPNVVFCGDMNWDDKIDGDPPLPRGWCDAWLTLRPNEEGLTYDSKENPMLSGSRLRKRLDRLFCHLDDFELESIERVGMDPIPGVTYEKETKMKKKPAQSVRLPVLPSDHFGLLLKISPRS